MSDGNAAHFESENFLLQNGETLPRLDVAYETYGDPANAGKNTILLLHGYTSSPHAAGRGDANPGWWENLIGPGRAIDTDRYFVVAPNMLGSAYGTTGPRSLNPATGKPYGPDFPEITTRDMIEVHSLLLDHLGAGELAAVVGYSYGGYLTFQWAVTHPDRMRALVPVATGISGRGDESTVQELVRHFEAAPGWNGGHHYDNGDGVEAALIDFRTNVLRNYGVDAELRDRGLDETAVAAALREQAAAWAAGFDPNSLIALRQCATKFDAKPLAARIAAPLLYVLATTDSLFGPDLGEATIAHIRKVAGVDASYFELDSPYGHRAPSVDWAKWGDALEDFLDRHARLPAEAAE
ncbi:MAG: alpha/beta fold hydrolase [Rickettsiales bacterium]